MKPDPSSVPSSLPSSLPPDAFVIDRSKPPYEVPCPECRAYALEPCRSGGVKVMPASWGGKSSWPEGTRVIPEPHQIRWKWWHEKPEYRVKAIVSKELPR